MAIISVISLALFSAVVTSFHHSPIICLRSKSASHLSNGWRRLSTTMSEPVVEESTTQTPKLKADFSSFAVGQEYDGSLISAKNFGIFVDISTGYNVLIPRSLLSRPVFEKLKQMTADKSKEIVRVALVGLSAENQTLTGKYISPKGNKERSDMSVLLGNDIKSKFFNATVVSSHDFGLFAVLDDFNVEGLVPASKLPEPLSAGAIKKTYPAGTKVLVQVSEMNVDDKKLILSMKFATRPGVDAFSAIPPNKWFQSIVQSVSSFGLFVRPAGFDSVGLVHASRVPRDLIAVLKKKAPITAGSNKTDIEALFAEGDVVKCRVQGVDVSSRRLELSMLPARNTEEEDDYVVPGRDPEGEEEKNMEAQGDDEQEHFDAEETLLWWRGSPYVKDLVAVEGQAVDEETEVIMESTDVIEGTWRRLFELDLREDENEFSSKVMEQELAELEEEIGELEGLDDDMTDSLGFGVPFTGSSLGLQVDRNMMPAGWGAEMDFFKEFDSVQSETITGLKGGKKAEQLEFEKLLKQVEQELENAASRPRAREEPKVDVVEALPNVVDESSTAVSEPEPAAANDA
eukprot:gene5256-10513_t